MIYLDMILNVIRDEEVLLVTHWDTDGICSAAKILLYRDLADTGVYIPPIGSYDIPLDEIGGLMPRKYMVITDFAVRDSIVKMLKDMFGLMVIFIDHHYHPVRDNAYYIDSEFFGRSFLSNTLLIDHLFGWDMDILSVFGLVGDLGPRAVDKDLYKSVESILDRYGLSIDDAYEITLLIDSCHILNDREAVRESIFRLIGYIDSPKDVISDSWFRDRYNKVLALLDELSSDEGLVIGDKYVLKYIDSPYYIISRVGRRIANRYYGKVTIIVNRGFYPDRDQVYVRSSGLVFDFHGLIDYCVGRGYVAGGKENVMGVILPKGDTENIIQRILSML
jgi:hypothetical protein